MKLLLLLALLVTVAVFVFQLRDLLRDRRIASYYRQVTQQEVKAKGKGVLARPLEIIRDQVEYVGKYSVQGIVTVIITLAILGMIQGLIFKSLLVGILAASFLGLLPAFHLLKLERKRIFLITQTLSTFLAGLKTEYQLKGRLKDSFIAMAPRVSELIRAEYNVFVAELDQNVELHEALYRLADKTKCIWFSHLGDIAEIAATRANKEGLLRTLDDLSVEIERHTREVSLTLQSIQRAGLYVWIMLAILGLSIYVTSNYIENPLEYFTRVAQGRKHLTVGVLFLILPIVTYYYRVARGVK